MYLANCTLLQAPVQVQSTVQVPVYVAITTGLYNTVACDLFIYVFIRTHSTINI